MGQTSGYGGRAQPALHEHRAMMHATVPACDGAQLPNRWVQLAPTAQTSAPAHLTGDRNQVVNTEVSSRR